MTLEARFRDKYESVPEAGCWLWTASTVRFGYGQIAHGGRPLPAHRASWLIHRGPLGPDDCVLHKCDTPSCVNPDHLFVGTRAENMADMIAKGRAKHPKGSATHNARLTENDVRAIRADIRSRVAIAAAYGIHATHVSQIKSRKKWAHVA